MYLQKFFLKTKEKSKNRTNRISSKAEKNIDAPNEASTHAYIYIIISQSGRKDLPIDRWIKIRIRLPEPQVTGFLHALRCVVPRLDLNARPISRVHTRVDVHTRGSNRWDGIELMFKYMR